ncbi:hypothetical protein GCM10010429_50390 [Micromonospora olivasterospora]
MRIVLNDRRFSADRQHPDFPQLVRGEAASRRPDEERILIAMDAPEHGPARKAVLGEFTVRRLEALRPRIQEIVDGQVDALLRVSVRDHVSSGRTRRTAGRRVERRWAGEPGYYHGRRGRDR